MNAIMSAVGFNMRQILRKLRIFWLYFLRSFLGNLFFIKKKNSNMDVNIFNKKILLNRL